MNGLDSKVVSQGPCPYCPSSDAYTTYDDGHKHCFSCDKTDQGKPYETGPSGSLNYTAGSGLPELTYRALAVRKLTEATCTKFKYGFADRQQHATFYDERGDPVAMKRRGRDKKFTWLGKSREATLFGQQLWKSSDRIKVAITEGEIDAMSLSQVQGNKWPVVSVKNGASGAKKDLAAQLEWLEQFKAVVLMFDSDEPGRKAALECAELFSPGKCSIATLPLKDPNEMLVAGDIKGLTDAFWNAKPFRPDGLVDGTDALQRVLEQRPADGDPFPWVGLNVLTRGMHPGTIITLCGGTGIGKSEVCRELAHWIIKQGKGFGYIALEESVRRAAQGVLSIEMEKPLHLLEDQVSVEDIGLASESLGFARKDVMFLDHFGSLDPDMLISKIRFMAKGAGIKYVVLDHVSIVVSGMRNDNERIAIDNLETDLRSVVEETQITLIQVSHLKRPGGDGKQYEEGRRPRMADLRGSASIETISDFIFGLRRNKRAVGPTRNLMTIEVLKNRHSGEEGDACDLRYSLETSRLTEVLASEGFEETTQAEGQDDGDTEF